MSEPRIIPAVILRPEDGTPGAHLVAEARRERDRDERDRKRRQPNPSFASHQSGFSSFHG